MGGDQEFAREGEFGGAAAEGFFGGDLSEIGVVVFLGDVREDEVARGRVKAFGVGEEFANGEI